MVKKCVICGKELDDCKATGTVRINGKYCSQECRREGIRRYSNAYYAEKSKDDNWRAHRTQQSTKRAKERRETIRDMFYRSRAEKLAKMTDVDDIMKLLEKDFRTNI